MRVPVAVRLATIGAFAVTLCSAQAPLIAYRGVYNAASQMPGGLPGGAIAQGSLFTITGYNIGPASQPDLSDPLQTTIGSVSVTVSQGSNVVSAIPLAVSPTTITAIMPSNAPLGMASVRITYNSKPSNPMPVKVTATQVGILTANGGGNGPALAQNDNGDGTTTGNSLQTPAYPGQTVYLSATGLGAIASDTAASPDTSNLTVVTEVFVGGVSASVVSNGRLTPGTDQIGFVIPDAAPSGCWTPVYVRTVGTAVSNFATISVSPDGSPCQEPGNFPASALVNGGNNGTYAAVRLNVRHDAGVRTPRDSTADLLGAYEAQEIAGPSNFNPIFSLPPAGSCTMYTVIGDLISNPAAIITGMTPPTGRALDDGGGASVTGDKGAATVQATAYPGISGTRLGSAAASLPLTQQPFLDGGGLTLSLAGGNDIGSGSAVISVPQPFTWSNRDTVLSITRTNGLNLTWTGGDPDAAVFIVVVGADLPSNSSAVALCIAAPGTTSFMVPPDVLANMPATRLRTIQSRGAVYIGQSNLASPTGLSAAGLDFGSFLPIFVGGKTVTFQ